MRMRVVEPGRVPGKVVGNVRWLGADDADYMADYQLGHEPKKGKPA